MKGSRMRAPINWRKKVCSKASMVAAIWRTRPIATAKNTAANAIHSIPPIGDWVSR